MIDVKRGNIGCSVTELWNLYDIKQEPIKTLQDFCGLYYKLGNRGQFVIWSHRDMDENAIALKDIILKEKVGTVHETEAVENPSYGKGHNNKMWTWTVDPIALKEWWAKHPVKIPTVQEKPVAGMVF